MTYPTESELKVCMKCGETASLVSGRLVYPHRPDLFTKQFYLCHCGAYVGCHPNTTKPLGCPAGPATRAARSAAHAAFDPLWKSHRTTRSEAYKWLASQFTLRPSETHISWMDAPTAKRVVELCKAPPQ